MIKKANRRNIIWTNDKIYVKDIFVMDTKDPYKTYFGFNTDLDLDRDRNCTPNQANHKTSQIIAYLLNNRKKNYIVI